MKRLFIHSFIFDKLLKSNNISDAVLRKVQEELCKNPEIGDVIKDTHGLRKMRFSVPGIGKSGGYRLFYLDIPEHEHTHLLLIIKKGDKENLTKMEQNEISKIILSIKSSYKKRKPHGKE